MNVLDSSTRPYLLRALYEWCADQGLTPHVLVLVDESVEVPQEYVRDGQIVLNVSASAVEGLKLDNELLSFRARFGGTTRDVMVPIDHVVAIYARENGEGMAFPVPTAESADESVDAEDAAASSRIQLGTNETTEASEDEDDGDGEPPKPPRGGPGSGKGGKKATLRRVK